MGQESIVKSTIIAKVKSLGSIEDSPLLHALNKILFKFDELEERIFGAPIVTLPHAAHISESVLAFSQPLWGICPLVSTRQDIGRTIRGGPAHKIKACTVLVDVHRNILYSTQ